MPSPHNYQTLSIQEKEIILKVAREKEQVSYKGRTTRITLDFSKKIKSLKGLDKCPADTNGPQMPVLNCTPSKTFNQPRWR